MSMKYNSSSRLERWAEAIFDELTIDELLAALDMMTRGGMPGDAVITIMRNKYDERIMIGASSVIDAPSTKQMF